MKSCTEGSRTPRIWSTLVLFSALLGNALCEYRSFNTQAEWRREYNASSQVVVNSQAELATAVANTSISLILLAVPVTFTEDLGTLVVDRDLTISAVHYDDPAPAGPSPDVFISFSGGGRDSPFGLHVGSKRQLVEGHPPFALLFRDIALHITFSFNTDGDTYWQLSIGNLLTTPNITQVRFINTIIRVNCGQFTTLAMWSAFQTILSSDPNFMLASVDPTRPRMMNKQTDLVMLHDQYFSYANCSLFEEYREFGSGPCIFNLEFLGVELSCWNPSDYIVYVPDCYDRIMYAGGRIGIGGLTASGQSGQAGAPYAFTTTSRKYRGNVSSTKKGNACASWAALNSSLALVERRGDDIQVLGEAIYHPVYNKAALLDKNYCRQVTALSTPWCYALPEGTPPRGEGALTRAELQREECDVAVCPPPTGLLPPPPRPAPPPSRVFNPFPPSAAVPSAASELLPPSGEADDEGDGGGGGASPVVLISTLLALVVILGVLAYGLLRHTGLRREGEEEAKREENKEEGSIEGFGLGAIGFGFGTIGLGSIASYDFSLGENEICSLRQSLVHETLMGTNTDRTAFPIDLNRDDKPATVAEWQHIFRERLGSVQVQLEEMIGSGASGYVFKGNWNGVVVAVKVVQVAATEACQKVILREVELAKSLRHPNIIATFMATVQTSNPVDVEFANAAQKRMVHCRATLLLEYGEGDLNAAIQRGLLKDEEGAPVMSMILNLLRDIANGMVYIHQQDIVHADLKPANIFYTWQTVHRSTGPAQVECGPSSSRESKESRRQLSDASDAPAAADVEVIVDGWGGRAEMKTGGANGGLTPSQSAAANLTSENDNPLYSIHDSNHSNQSNGTKASVGSQVSSSRSASQLGSGSAIWPKGATYSVDLVAKIGDFGLSRSYRGAQAAGAEGQPRDGQQGVSNGGSGRKGRLVGTVTHMPPEGLTEGQVLPQADVFAFGVIMWEMYMQEKPYAAKAGEPPLCQLDVIRMVARENKRLEFSPCVPAAYKALVDRCWHGEVSQRPSFVEIVQTIKILQETIVQ